MRARIEVLRDSVLQTVDSSRIGVNLMIKGYIEGTWEPSSKTHCSHEGTIVPHCPQNFRGFARFVTELNAAFCLVARA